MHRRRAFTLVELLVVIAILAILVVLLLPAVQAAREAARRTQCLNYVKQLTLAVLNHESAQRHYPTGGWPGGYVGDADRGFGRDQPGGWMYNILPFMEEQELHDVNSDGQPNAITDKQKKGNGILTDTALPVLFCPSRREPFKSTAVKLGNHHVIPGAPEHVGKNDYAINVGDQGREITRDPACLSPLGRLLCPEKIGGSNQHSISPFSGQHEYTGVSFPFSIVRVRHVTDGTSKTYLLGEKFLDPRFANLRDFGGTYYTGDDLPWCAGADISVHRTGWWRPVRDRRSANASLLFGSSHPVGCHMSFCDGSIRMISYDIDQLVHLAASNRHDGWVPGQKVEFPQGAYWGLDPSWQ